MRTLCLVLCLACFALQPTSAATITEAEIGEVVAVIDTQIGHIWAGVDLADVIEVDWTNYFQYWRWNGDDWEPALDEYPELEIMLPAFDPADELPDADPVSHILTIDELNAALYNLDWPTLAEMLDAGLPDQSDPDFSFLHIRAWELVTCEIPAGTSTATTIPVTSDASRRLGDGNPYHVGLLLDRIELSVYEWHQLPQGARLAIDFKVYAEITHGLIIPEPTSISLLLAMLIGNLWSIDRGWRRGRNDDNGVDKQLDADGQHLRAGQQESGHSTRDVEKLGNRRLVAR